MDTCEEILITITRNKTRSLLTAFGVFWGIFMLVALIGGGQGLEGMMKKNLVPRQVVNMAVKLYAERENSEVCLSFRLMLKETHFWQK